MNKSVWIAIVVIFVIVIIAISSQKPSSPANAQSFKIGAMFVLSGDAAKYGEVGRNGVEMALAKYNSSPDVVSGKKRKVEVIYEDTHGDPKTAVSVYQKFTSIDRVDAILGPFFVVEATAIAPLAKKDNFPVVAIAPIGVEQRGANNPLAIWPDPTLEARQFSEYVFSREGVKSVAILTTKDPWEAEVAQGFNDRFKEIGGKVTAYESVLSDKDTSVPVAKALESKPEAIYLGTYLKFQYFIKKIRELGFKGKIYSIEVDDYLADVTKPYGEGTVFISPAYFTPEFKAEYKAKYNAEPSIPAGQAYDATEVLLSFITNGTDLVSQMAAIKEYDGVSGKIQFTEDHRTLFPLSIFKVQDGKIVPVE